MIQKTVSKNIMLFYLFSLARGSLFCIPFMVPFWKENSMNMTEIMILQSFFSVLVVILEVPSGYIADKMGSRNTLMAGGFLFTAGFLLYCFFDDFAFFFLAEGIIALGFSCISGADSSFLWETLAMSGREAEYKKIFGRGFFIMMMAVSVADVAGGFLALVSMRLTIVAGIPFLALMPLSAFFMKDPVFGRIPATKVQEMKGSISPVFHTEDDTESGGKQSSFFKTLYHLPWKNIFPVIIPSALLFTAVQSSLWLYPDFFEDCSLSITWYGWIFAAFNLFGGFVSSKAGKIEQKIGLYKSRILLAFMNVAGFTGMVLLRVPFAVLFCFGSQFSRGFSQVVFSDALNKRVRTEHRATALSLMSLVGRLGYSAIIPLIGLVSDHFGLTAALTVLLAFSVITLMFMTMQRKEPVDKSREC